MSIDVKMLDREWIRSRSQQQQEPEWMLDFRLRAWDLFEELPLPKVEKMRIQRWNFMDFMTSNPQEVVHSQEDSLPEEVVQTLQLADNQQDRALLIQENDQAIFQWMSEDLESRGVLLKSLDQALRENEDLVRQYFMREAMSVEEHRLTALHGALWNGGLFVYVPKNQQVEIPLEFFLWATGSNTGYFPHLLLVAEEHSRLTFVEHAAARQEDVNGTFVGGTEVYVGSGARVRFASVRLLPQAMTEFTYRRAVVKGDGRMEWILGEMNDGNTCNENVSFLQEPGATADSKMITIGQGRQQANYVSRTVHQGHHTESEIFSRGVTKDQSWVILNSVTRIFKGAAKANGQQSGSMLMLSEKSRGDANPILYIDEDDVQAGHAASVGQVNPEQVYYLMSRGISRKEAEKLIAMGFLMPVVSQIPTESLRSHLQAIVERKVVS